MSGAFEADSFKQRLVLARLRGERELGLHPTSARIAHFAAGGCTRAQIDHASSEGGRVTWRDQMTGAAVLDDFGRPANRGGDDRHAGGRCF